MEKITSVKNQKIKQWKKLHLTKGRKESNQYVIEGEHLYLEAVKSDVEALQHASDELKNDLEVVLEAISKNKNNITHASKEMREKVKTLALKR